MALRGKSEYATAYKLLFAAAALSTRAVPWLAKKLVETRDSLKIDFHDGVQISVAVVERLGILPEGAAPTEEEANRIVALICQLLKVDQVTHVREASTLRLTLMALGAKPTPETLQPLIAQEPAELFGTFSASVAAKALHHIFRIAVCDDALRSSEVSWINALPLRRVLSHDVIKQVLRLVTLETGFELHLEALEEP